MYPHVSQCMCQHLSMIFTSISSTCPCTSYLSSFFCRHYLFRKWVLGRFAPRVNKVNKRQPSILMIYFMLHVCNHYLFTNWRPFSLIKQQILQNCNTVMMAFVDALILTLMFSQWSLISCTKGCCSCTSGFLWRLTTSLIYRKSVSSPPSLCSCYHPIFIQLSVWECILPHPFLGICIMYYRILTWAYNMIENDIPYWSMVKT